MSRKRFLPEFVTHFRDRHGKDRLRFRRVGYPGGYFRAALGTEAFRAEYRAFLDAERGLSAPQRELTVPGTVDDLVQRYFSVPARLGPTPTTQAKVRSIIERFREGRGDRPVAAITFEHIDAIVAKARVKVKTDRGWLGGIEAARKLRKELVRLFDFAIKAKMMSHNPARQSETIRVAAGARSTGFHSWTEGEIAQFRLHWQLGTRQRLAMELMLWTDQRGGDVHRLGRQHIKQGRFELRQGKGGKALSIRVAPQLTAAIVAMPATNSMCFLVTQHGKPFSPKGFSQWFSAQCTFAGLPQCTAHGLRKATMRRMAERGMSNQTMKAMSGHTQDSEVATYTAAANQRGLADEAISALSQWEMSNPFERLDTDEQQGTADAG